MHLTRVLACVLTLSVSSAWSIKALLTQDGQWPNTAALLVSICATLCVIWLFSGHIRRALLLWLSCAVIVLAWYHMQQQPNAPPPALAILLHKI